MVNVREPLDPKISLWHFLAYVLRCERERHGLSLTQCGQIIGAARSTVSNIEAARLKIDVRQAQKLDERYGLPRLCETLLWFAQMGHDPMWFQQYTQYESRADVIRVYQGQVIPVPLQTEDYARAFVELGDSADVEAAIAARMARQKALLTPSKGPMLIVLLDENALHRPVGGPQVMAAQLQRLLELGRRSRVIIRVIPRSVGAYDGLDGSFQIMSLESRDIAYIGALRGGRLVEVPSEVRELGMDFERIGAIALSREESRALIAKVMEEYLDPQMA
ncbi:helix-turn-helix transcriptional regulator [Actinomadura sp. 9N407]|uniref:helix-turn-helix transcriptional regulator n=1 Tax=Actinomadura sp. 9N407 TaxID=3375154 RepID=UPI00379543DD